MNGDGGEVTVPTIVEDREALHRVIEPQNCRGERPHYMAFWTRKEPRRYSVDRAEFRSIQKSLERHPTWGLAAINAGVVRSLEFTPALQVIGVPENDNDAHAEIRIDEKISKTQIETKISRKLADNAVMVQQPAPAPGEESKGS